MARTKRSRAARKYWREVKEIARDERVSIRKARRLYRGITAEKLWKVIIEDDYGRFEDVSYIYAESREEAQSMAYSSLINEVEEVENFGNAVNVHAVRRFKVGEDRFRWKRRKSRKRR